MNGFVYVKWDFWLARIYVIHTGVSVVLCWFMQRKQSNGIYMHICDDAMSSCYKSPQFVKRMPIFTVSRMAKPISLLYVGLLFGLLLASLSNCQISKRMSLLFNYSVMRAWRHLYEQQCGTFELRIRTEFCCSNDVIIRHISLPHYRETVK